MKKIITTLWSLFICNLLFAQTGSTDNHIKVDQFGYLPSGQKIAVISNPMVGFNANDKFTPGTIYEIRTVSDNSVAYSGKLTSWNNDETHSQSGDQVWWFDFSELTTPGEYYLYDPVNDVSSYIFEISQHVYNEVLKQSVRTYYYQRCGLAKVQPYAGINWVDATPCHHGTQQDMDCRFVLNTSSATSKDLSGGWHDAGDYNKYINYADGVVHTLLLAYEENPDIWKDNYDIPESGNGVSDLLDEIKWELDWFLKMQNKDGSVLHKVSVTNWDAGSPPSSDNSHRRYAPATASAAISACGVFAHGAIVFKSLSNTLMQNYGNTLESAAIAAWNWLIANSGQIPSYYDNAGFVNSAAEDDPYSQSANRTSAAVYLFVLTGENSYKTYVDNFYNDIHLLQWQYASPFEAEYQNALLYYSKSSDATASVATAIKNAYQNSMSEHLTDFLDDIDAYRAYIADGNYTWGSNKTKCCKGSMFFNMIEYSLDAYNQNNYLKAAAGYIHYMHGINPLAITYLSNMGNFGAESSVPEFYHGWFHDGTNWDNAVTSLYGPAPGYVPGGPNPHYSPDAAYTGLPIEPPQNQPIQKSFRSWNTSWPENSWEVTENHIPYQSAYIKLLSKFVSSFDTPVSFINEPIEKKWKLLQNYPNPFNATTTIFYHLPQASMVKINIYNTNGQLVETLINEHKTAGYHIVQWNVGGAVSGLYLYQIRAGGFTEVNKCVVIK